MRIWGCPRSGAGASGPSWGAYCRPYPADVQPMVLNVEGIVDWRWRLGP